MVGSILRRGHVTPHRLALGWLSAQRRRQYFIGLRAFKIVANSYPPYLVGLLSCRVNVNFDLHRTVDQNSLFKRTLLDTLFSRDVADWIARLCNEGLPTHLLFRARPLPAMPRVHPLTLPWSLIVNRSSPLYYVTLRSYHPCIIYFLSLLSFTIVKHCKRAYYYQ